MGRKRIAIDCQGGGSQCAFVRAALKALFAERIQDHHPSKRSRQPVHIASPIADGEMQARLFLAEAP